MDKSFSLVGFWFFCAVYQPRRGLVYLVYWGEVECCCDGVDVVDVEVFEGEGVVIVGVVADVGLPGVVEGSEGDVVVVDGVGGVEALELLVNKGAGCGGVLSGGKFLGDVVGGGCVVGGDEVDKECGASGAVSYTHLTLPTNREG